MACKGGPGGQLAGGESSFRSARLVYNASAMKWTWNWIFIAVAAGVCGGIRCVPGNIYHQTDGQKLAMYMTPKHSWKASGTLPNAAAGIDGDLATTARAGFRAGNAQLTLDLGDNCVFQSVIIDHGEDQYGCGRRVGVATSVDGKVFVPRYSAHGTRRVTHLLLPKPIMARYVRIRVITPGRRPWAVAEVYIQ